MRPASRGQRHHAQRKVTRRFLSSGVGAAAAPGPFGTCSRRSPSTAPSSGSKRPRTLSSAFPSRFLELQPLQQAVDALSSPKRIGHNAHIPHFRVLVFSEAPPKTNSHYDVFRVLTLGSSHSLGFTLAHVASIAPTKPSHVVFSSCRSFQEGPP